MKNVMLLSLSKTQTNSTGTPIHHIFHWDSKKIGCLHPNEPAIQFVQDQLRRKSETIDSIFYFASQNVKSNLPTQKISHEKFFRSLPICRGKKLQAIEIQSEDGLDSILKMSQLIQNIAEQFGENVRLHVDLTCGNSSILLAISQILNRSGIESGLIVYSNFETHRVENSSEVCRLFNLFAGVGEFINFCDVRSIEKYFANRKSSPELQRLLDKIRQFDYAIEICRTAEMESLAAELREAMMDFAFVENKTMQEKIFVNLLEIFEAEYRDILNEDLSRLDIIHYCARKNFLQQAMTLCTEWLPVYFVQKKFCYPQNPEVKNYVEPMHSRWEQTFIVNFSFIASRFVPKKDPPPESKSTPDPKPSEIAKKLKAAAAKLVETDEKFNASKIGIVNSKVDRIFAAISRAEKILQAARESNQTSTEFVQKHDREIFQLSQYTFKKYIQPPGTTFEDFLKKRASRKLFLRAIQGTSDANMIQMFELNSSESAPQKVETPSEKIRWRKLFDVKGILTDFDFAIEKVALVLKKYSAIREQRNLINHASEKTVLTNDQIREMILDCINSIRDLEKIPEGAFINHTQQQSRLWTPEKISAAGNYGEIVDLLFPEIDPAWDEEKISMLAKSNADRIESLNPSAVLCQGDDLSYVFAIVSELKSRGILVLFASGKVDFAQFRSYEALPLA